MDNFLNTKTLVMLVAPTAMGKSTIANIASRLDERFQRVKSFTTRPPRANDEPGQYIYLSATDLSIKRASGTLITEAVYPSSNDVYGTVRESYPGEYCLLDTMSNSVDTYRNKPFRQTITISMTAPAEAWHQRLLTRFPESSTEAIRRLDEASISINWSLNDSNTLWLTNDDTPEVIAQRLIDLTLDSRLSDEKGPENARAILELIHKREIWPS